MKCPLCEVTLQMTERQGIEIDYCPECRGVWLDRGELDKIIARAGAESAAPESREPAPRRDEPAHRDESRSYDERRHDDRGYKDEDSRHKKRKSPTSLIGDLFDF